LTPPNFVRGTAPLKVRPTLIADEEFYLEIRWQHSRTAGLLARIKPGATFCSKSYSCDSDQNPHIQHDTFAMSHFILLSNGIYGKPPVLRQEKLKKLY
jgi:hypothetical protein